MGRKSRSRRNKQKAEGRQAPVADAQEHVESEHAAAPPALAQPQPAEPAAQSAPPEAEAPPRHGAGPLPAALFARRVFDRLKLFGRWCFFELKAAYARLPERKTILSHTRELLFGADPQCSSLTGPARPVMRLVAAVYDLALLFLVNSVVAIIAGYLAAERFAMPLNDSDPNVFVPTEVKSYLLAGGALSFIISWLYLTVPEALPFRATLGKKLCSIQTVDIHGGKVSYLRANLRLAAKFASIATLGLGYLIAVTRKDRRALHDVMARTQVVREG